MDAAEQEAEALAQAMLVEVTAAMNRLLARHPHTSMKALAMALRGVADMLDEVNRTQRN